MQPARQRIDMNHSVLYVGLGGAQFSSRSYALHEAGLHVRSARPDELQEVAAAEQPDIVLLEPGVANADCLAEQLGADERTASIEILDLSEAQRMPNGHGAASALALAVSALLRLHTVEQALRETDARFVSVADTAPVLIWMAGPNRQCEYFNQSWLQFTGRGLQEEVNDGWTAGIHPDDRARRRNVFDEAFDNRADFEIEYRLHHRDGAFRWVLDRGVPRYTPDGIFAGYIGTCVDIDERRRVEEALRFSEINARLRAEELEAFMEIAPVAICIAHDPLCRQMTANRTAYEMLRQPPRLLSSPATAQNRDWAGFKAFKNGVELSAEQLPMQLAASSGRETVDDIELVFPDGGVTTVMGRAVPLRDTKGKVRGALGAFLDISERKQMEAALRRSEEQLQLAVGAGEIGLWFWDLTNDTMVWNDQCKRLFGLAADATVAYAWFLSTLHAQDRNRVEKLVTAAVDGSGEFNAEYRVMLKDGVRWISSRGRVRYGADGKPHDMMGVATDVTPRKRAEEALRASEQRFRALIEQSNDLICIADENARVRYVSGSVPRILGRDSAELLSKDLFAGMHADDVPAMREVFRRSLAQPSQSLNVQHRQRHADGGWRWIEGSFTNQLAEPAIRGVVAIFRDITERKQAEVERERLLNAEVTLRELAEENERRSALLAEVSEAMAATLDYRGTLNAVARKAVPLLGDCCLIHLVDVDGNLQRVGRACAYAKVQQLFEAQPPWLPTPESLDHPVMQALTSGNVVVLDRIEDDCLQRISLSPDHLAYLRELQPTAFFVVPLVAYGERVGVLSFLLVDPLRRLSASDVRLAQEIASRIAMGVRNCLLYAEAERARRQAEEAGRVKDEFLATVSHELRQPVHAIGGWVRLLKTGKLGADKSVRALDTIEQNVVLQGQIVNDLLDVSAMITGQLQLEVRPMSIFPVIESAVETVRPAADAKGITLDVRLDPAVGMLSGDPARLQQVIWNLLSNAVKFTPRGGSVQVELKRTGDDAQIVVRDNGPGINPEFLPYVFDRFRQEDGTMTRRHGGLGLGLAIVRNVVELHGGTVQAANDARDGGAVFIAQLPLIAQATQPAVANA